jgi:hypothetical protein
VGHMKIMEHDYEMNEWIDRGEVPFRGLPRANSTIEIDKDGVPFLYLVLSFVPSVDGGDGVLMIRELGSSANCLESIYIGGDEYE